MKRSRLFGVVCACVFVFVATSSNASLVVQGDGTVFDSDLDIYWLAEANLSAANDFGVAGINANGSMTWNTAIEWIAAMNVANHLGFNDWRLPDTLVPDPNCEFPSNTTGHNCTGSEMGHLFYEELGGVAGTFILDGGNSIELAKFSNIQERPYWSSTDAIIEGFDNHAWAFWFGGTAGTAIDPGTQTIDGKNNVGTYAWAVRSGTVSTVPVPAAVWLFGSGLIGLVGMARRKKAA